MPSSLFIDFNYSNPLLDPYVSPRPFPHGNDTFTTCITSYCLCMYIAGLSNSWRFVLVFSLFLAEGNRGSARTFASENFRSRIDRPRTGLVLTHGSRQQPCHRPPGSPTTSFSPTAMSNNNRFSNQRFFPHSIQAFLWGRARNNPNNATGSQQGQLRSYILGTPTHK